MNAATAVPVPFVHCLPVVGERPRKMPTAVARTAEARSRARKRRAQAVRLYALGMSIAEIARVQRINTSRARKDLIAEGVALRPSGGQPGPRVVDDSADCTCEGTVTLYARGHRCMRTRAAHAAQMRAHRAAVSAGASS